jgi:hypothetical protein
MHAKPVFHLPFAFQAHEALVDIGSHVWVYVQIEFLDANLVDEVVNLTLQLVGEKNTRRLPRRVYLSACKYVDAAVVD